METSIKRMIKQTINKGGSYARKQLERFKNNINHAEDKNKTDSGEKIAPIGRNLCIALVALCVVNIIAHLACYSRLPENVPIHWGADGSVNGYGPRAVTLILDVLPLLCLGLFLVIPKMDPKEKTT